MKKLVFRNGIYTVLRPLYYLCKVFGLAPYSYVADRRNKRATSDYGYWNYMFTVIWLIVYTVGLAVQILVANSVGVIAQTRFIALILVVISSYTSSIIAVVCISIIKRRTFLDIIENISEVDNKIGFTHQEETYMNKNVMFNIISEFILLTVFPSSLIIYIIYQLRNEEHYIICATLMILCFSYICNISILMQFLNLVFMVKQRYGHLNKRLTTWINGTVSRPTSVKKKSERCFGSARTVDHMIITPLRVSSVGNIEGTLRQTDIHWLRQIYSELYDITCLINDTYVIAILALMCWMLTGMLCSLYEVVVNFKGWGITNIVYAIIFIVFLFKVTFYCHTATNEARSSRIVVQKLLLEGNCRNECVKEFKMFSLQLQEMTNDFNACGFFSVNLKLFVSVVSAIVSYIIIMVQIK